MSQLQTCVDCGGVAPAAEFPPSYDGRGGRRKYCAECGRARNAAKNRRWRKANREAYLAAQARWAETDHAKVLIAAKNAVLAAVRRGDLTPATRCEDCDSEQPLEAHHEDYSKQLEVMWLCQRCHMARHGKTLRVSA